MAKRAASATERRYMGRVAALCCGLCQFLRLADDTPALVHHLRTGTGRGRASHFDTMPLCPTHHDGNDGLHGLGVHEFERVYGITEIELLARTKRALGSTA